MMPWQTCMSSRCLNISKELGFLLNAGVAQALPALELAAAGQVGSLGVWGIWGDALLPGFRLAVIVTF
jgi:hypothetical protein